MVTSHGCWFVYGLPLLLLFHGGLTCHARLATLVLYMLWYRMVRPLAMPTTTRLTRHRTPCHDGGRLVLPTYSSHNRHCVDHACDSVLKKWPCRPQSLPLPSLEHTHARTCSLAIGHLSVCLFRFAVESVLLLSPGHTYLYHAHLCAQYSCVHSHPSPHPRFAAARAHARTQPHSSGSYAARYQIPS